jgi:hypothetical protein
MCSLYATRVETGCLEQRSDFCTELDGRVTLEPEQVLGKEEKKNSIHDRDRLKNQIRSHRLTSGIPLQTLGIPLQTLYLYLSHL